MLSIVLPSVSVAAEAPQRGKLLYATHCSACHTSAVHWREKKLVTDFASLEMQVRRWQNSAGLNWTAEEIRQVSLYLNEEFYHFTGRETLSRMERAGRQ